VSVQTLEVSEDEEGMRLDRWFKRHFPSLGHARLEKLLRTGQIRLDGMRAKDSERTLAGRSVRVPPPLSSETREYAPERALKSAPESLHALVLRCTQGFGNI